MLLPGPGGKRLGYEHGKIYKRDDLGILHQPQLPAFQLLPTGRIRRQD